VLNLFEIIKEYLFSNIFTLIFGISITMIYFFLTANSNTTEEIKGALLQKTQKKLKLVYKTDFQNISIDKLYFNELGLSSEKTIFLMGTAVYNKEYVKWITVFEKAAPRLIDKIVGRPGSYELTSISSAKVSDKAAFTFEKIESFDIDSDGILEVHLTIKTLAADCVFVGPLFLSKNDSGKWELLTIPSISEKHKENYHHNKMPLTPIDFFGMVGDEGDLELGILDLKKLDVLEEQYEIIHNDSIYNLNLLKNGGDYFIKEHEVRGYTQIQTLSFLNDGNAVLMPHYAVVIVFKIYNNKLIIDELWNWGNPIYSIRPLKLVDIDVDSIYKAGIFAHTDGDVFFGETEFEKIRKLN